MKMVNPEAETKAILSLLCVQKDVADNVQKDIQSNLLSSLNKEHFGFDQMNICFSILSSIASSSTIPSLEIFVQYPQLTQEAKDILENPNATPVRTVEEAKDLINILEYWRKFRRCYELALTISGKMKGETPPEIIDLSTEIEKTLSELRTAEEAKKTWHIGHGHNSDELINNMLSEEKPRLIKSTFNNFDSKVGGFGSQDLFILASHAKGGKSIMALNMCLQMYFQSNLNVIMFSLEMRAWEVMERVMAALTGIEHSKFRQKNLSPTEQDIVRKAWERFEKHGKDNNCRFTLKDTTSLTVAEFKLECKNRGYQVACIDYINLMKIPGQKKEIQDWERISVLGRDLKEATKECDMMIMAPTQMNDDGGLRYSKALLEHANTVWRWHSKDEATRISHQIKIIQEVVRGWAPFPFMVREDFERCQVFDGAAYVPDDEPAKVRDQMKKMYSD